MHCPMEIKVEPLTLLQQIRWWDMACLEKCLLCNKTKETARHVFLNCKYSTYNSMECILGEHMTYIMEGAKIFIDGPIGYSHRLHTRRN